MGIRLIASVPQPTATSTTPELTRDAASAVACWEEPHCASTVVAATEIGSPAPSQALRVTFKACSPTCPTQPPTTWPTSFGSIPVRSTSSPSTSSRSSAGWTPDNMPSRRPIGVRTASTTTVSDIWPLSFEYRAAPRSPPDEAEQVSGDVANLDLLRALGDAVPPVVTVDVLEGLVSGVPDAAVHLHRAVGRLADETVGAVVAHRDLVADAADLAVAGVHLVRRLADERAKELYVGGQLDQRPLDRLALRQRLAEGLALLRVLDALGHAVVCRAHPGGRLAQAVLVHEEERDVEPPALLAEDRVVRDADIAQLDLGVVGRHVEGPVEVGDLEPGAVRGDDERRDAPGLPRLSRRAGEHDRVLGEVHPAGKALGAVDHPVAPVAGRSRLQPGGVAPMVRLREVEGELVPAGDRTVEEALLLLLGAELVEDQWEHEVADDGRLGLEVVVQAEALGGEVIANHGHAEVGPVESAHLPRQRVAEDAGRVSAAPHLVQKLDPLAPVDAVVLEVRPGPLPPVVEELPVLRLERLDLPLDEVVEPLDEFGQFLRKTMEDRGQGDRRCRSHAFTACSSFACATSSGSSQRGFATRSRSTTRARTAASTSSIRSSRDPDRIASHSSASSRMPSRASRDAWARSSSGPSSSSRSSWPTALAATRVRKRKRPSLACRSSSSRKSRTARASSAAVVMPCAMSRRLAILEQEQHVVLLLPHTAPDGGQLDRALASGQVAPCLPHAADAPPHGAVQLPPAHDLRVHRAAADPLVAAEEVGVGTEAADRVVGAEAPRAHAEIAEILHRVAAMHVLPIEHRTNAVRSDDEVAVAEVAVEEHVVGRLRPVLLEPAQPELKGGTGVVELGQRRAQRREHVGTAEAGNLRERDAVDAREDLAALLGEPGPDRRELVVAQDAPCE